VGGRVPWQPVLPLERLRFARRAGAPERRRAADGWLLTAPEPPRALSVLEAFDEVPGAADAFRVLQAHRPRGARPVDPAVDPLRYEMLEPPRFPLSFRRHTAIVAMAGALLAVLAALIAPARVAFALVLAIAVAGAVVAKSHSPRAVLSERAVYRLLPDLAEAAREDWFDLSAPAARARATFTASGIEGLTPILYSRPETAAYAVARTGTAEQVRDLPLPAGGRRIFRSLSAETLAGPIEVAGDRFVNRTGRDFAEVFLVRGDEVAAGGALEDGGTLSPPTTFVRAAELAATLDRRGPSGHALRNLLTVELASGGAAARGYLVLVGRAPAPPRVTDAAILATESLPAVYILLL
jgi:hypothetical protein